MEIGVIGTNAPELKTRLLFRDRFIGICRTGHPILSGPGVTVERYAGYLHVVVSRKGQSFGPVDDALAQRGLQRTVAMVVPTHANAIQTVRNSDLIGLIPLSCLGNDGTNAGIEHFELPIATPPIKISAIWHPRLHADPAHRWLRETIMAACKRAQSGNEG